MSKTIIVNTLAELDHATRELLNHCKSDRIFAFYAEMGAGKTTFIKSLCHHLGVTDIVTSPTFSVINEYQNKASEKIYHFDFYRILHENEAYDMGYEDYFYGNSFCFIEWPEKIQRLIPENSVNVSIKVKDDQRIIAFNR